MEDITELEELLFESLKNFVLLPEDQFHKIKEQLLSETTEESLQKRLAELRQPVHVTLLELGISEVDADNKSQYMVAPDISPSDIKKHERQLRIGMMTRDLFFSSQIRFFDFELLQKFANFHCVSIEHAAKRLGFDPRNIEDSIQSKQNEYQARLSEFICLEAASKIPRETYLH